MYLINFKEHAAFNELRSQMAAEYKVMNFQTNWNNFNEDEFLERLKSEQGIDVKLEDVQIDKDGCYSYKGQKVVVYIRDQRQQYSGSYKYHLTECRTIKDFIENKRYDRYVVSNNPSGNFLINIIHNERVVKSGELTRLHVCKNCLAELKYKGYTYRTGNGIYESFNLEEYFRYYKKPFGKLPRYEDNITEINMYPTDFINISRQYRESKDWKCEKCGGDFSDNKKNLHTHHINGVKFDNNYENLRALCARCHSEEPDHDHMLVPF